MREDSSTQLDVGSIMLELRPKKFLNVYCHILRQLDLILTLHVSSSVWPIKHCFQLA